MKNLIVPKLQYIYILKVAFFCLIHGIYLNATFSFFPKISLSFLYNKNRNTANKVWSCCSSMSWVASGEGIILITLVLGTKLGYHLVIYMFNLMSGEPPYEIKSYTGVNSSTWTWEMYEWDYDHMWVDWVSLPCRLIMCLMSQQIKSLRFMSF